jgi:hypothetical protein
MCVFIFSTPFGLNISLLRRTKQDIIINVYSSSCNVPVIHVRFEWNFNYHGIFSKYPLISNFMKIRPVGAHLFHAKGHTLRS